MNDTRTAKAGGLAAHLPNHRPTFVLLPRSYLYSVGGIL